MIEVTPYDPSWPVVFESLRTRYERALSGVPVIAIEHVGSTAVPGLAAKPVIDIDVIVDAPHADAAIAAMERIGFELRGDLGISHRWALRAPTGFARTNTYVVIDGSLALRNHLGVRDVLREDADLREQYGALKQSLALRMDNLDHYVEAKTGLLSVILARAGLNDDERRQIEDANRSS